MSKAIPSKKRIHIFEILSKLPGLSKDLPKFVEALYYNYTITPETEISFGHFLRDAAKRYPNNVCIRYANKKWTYQEFNSWVNRLAHAFTAAGIRKGDVVALLIENRPEILAISMALSKLGAITALINTSQCNQTLLHSFQLSKAKLILVGEELLSAFIDIQNEVMFSKTSVYLIRHLEQKNRETTFTYFDISAHSYYEHEPQPSSPVCAKDACLYIYTSGTTGLPKASVISHGRWIKGYAAFGLVNLRLKQNDILYVALPFYHATAMVVCWSSVLAAGASVVIKNKFSVKEFWKDIQQHQATAMAYVGELCKYLLNAPVSPLEKNNTLQKMIGNGMRPDIWNAFKQRFGVEQIAEFYGSSEGNIAFFNVFNLEQTMGFSIADYAVIEYDKENEEPMLNKNGFCTKVKTGEVGLLLGEISQRYPYDGYTENEKTEQTILRHVFKKGDAWFNTNDLVRDMGFGHTQFVDRLGDTFRWKGENVSTMEVEHIIHQYEGIEECTAYGVEIPEQLGKAGMVNLVTKENRTTAFDVHDFYEFLSQHLPAYAIPIFLRFGEKAETTDTFKHKKKQLKEEAYHINKVPDRIYVLKNKQYVLMDNKQYKQIQSGNM